jgi:hypothetical protein
MSADTLPNNLSESLRQSGEILLDQCSLVEMFVQRLLDMAIEHEPITAACVMELSATQPPRLLAGQALDLLAVNGIYDLDPNHIALLQTAIRQQAMLVMLDRTVPDSVLKPHSLILAPVPGSGPRRVVELLMLQAPSPEEVAQLKDVAAALADCLQRFHERQPTPREPAAPSAFWQQFDALLLKLQQSLDVRRTIAIAVNDGRLLLGCDRVSIALKHGSRTRIAGISGQESIQQRARLVKFMSRVADVVLRLGSPITYAGEADDLPPQLEEPLAAYLAESRMRMVQMIPLREPVPLALDDSDPNARQDHGPRKVLGVLMIEQALEARPKPGLSEKAELLAPHVETALANAERHESIFLLPLWRGIGRMFRWFKGRRLWTALAIVCLLILVGLALALIPWEYRVEGTGLAMPVVQHEVFAPWDADVRDIRIDSGQRVKAGDVLLVLESDELDAEKIATQNELQEKQKLVLALAQQQHAARRKGDVEELARLEADFVKATIEAKGARTRLDKIESRIAKLTITAPADGVIATFQVRQLLQHRPVRRGELLLEVMEPQGEWRLELEIPEYRMGHLLRQLNSSPERTLPVDYVLATAVETSHQGTLTEVATRSNESSEEGTILEAYVQIDPRDLPYQNIGAEVIAKIHCGKKSLFYVLFGDVVEFVQRYLWL